MFAMAKPPFHKTLKNSPLLRMGVPEKIERWMLGNRGKRFPSTAFARKHGVALSSVTNLTARISQHYWLAGEAKGRAECHAKKQRP